VKTAAERLCSPGFDASTSVRDGDPKMVILDCATKWKADLIVVGSHGHKGVTRFVSGSMSDSVALAMPIARSKSRTFPATANGFTAS